MNIDTYSKNAIKVILIYKWNGLWCFDDEQAGLKRELFVSGMDDIIEKATVNVPRSRTKGVLCAFSDKPFPGHTLRLDFIGADDEKIGNWYRCEKLDLKGWLCPALFCYFAEAPKRIHAQFFPVKTK